MDGQGLHAMVCKKTPGKIARHHVLNDIIWRAFGAAGIPAVKEQSLLGLTGEMKHVQAG